MDDKTHTLAADTRHTTYVLLGTVVFLIATGAASYAVSGKGDFMRWFNGPQLSWESVLSGMTYGILFGVIDNTLMVVGVDGLQSIYKKLPGGATPSISPLYGNTFSSFVSTMCTSFIGDVIRQHISWGGPVWSQALGVLVGCLTIIMGRLAFTRTTKQPVP